MSETTDLLQRSRPIDGFIRKLERRSPLPPEAREAMLSLPCEPLKYSPQDVVTEEGDLSVRCLFVDAGFVTRQKSVDGSRQIMGIGLPGDAVDLQSLWFCCQDHSLVVHAPTVLIAIEREAIASLCWEHPALGTALWHDTLADAAIFREWTLNVAHRRALPRIAHFFLEIAARLRGAGAIACDVFELPLTQSDLASALGLSLVHVNKSLRALKEQGLLSVKGRIVELKDRAALEQLTCFDPTYLHIAETPHFSSRSSGSFRSS